MLGFDLPVWGRWLLLRPTLNIVIPYLIYEKSSLIQALVNRSSLKAGPLEVKGKWTRTSREFHNSVLWRFPFESLFDVGPNPHSEWKDLGSKWVQWGKFSLFIVGTTTHPPNIRILRWSPSTRFSAYGRESVEFIRSGFIRYKYHSRRIRFCLSLGWVHRHSTGYVVRVKKIRCSRSASSLCFTSPCFSWSTYCLQDPRSGMKLCLSRLFEME